MKKQNPLLTFVVGLVIAGSIGVYATIKVQSSEIGYKDGTVEDALDDLYGTADQIKAIKKFCELKSGTALTVGAKYECDPGDGTKRNFYLLSLDNDRVDLIMDRNITQGSSATTMTWFNAIEFFEQGQPGYTTKQSWTNVQSIDLPAVQDIVDASLVINPKDGFSFTASTASATWWCLGSHVQDQPSGPLYCPSNANQQKIAWLFNYTRGCSSRGCSNEYSDTDGYPYGYWTKDIIRTDTSCAWGVGRNGNLGSDAVSNSTIYGVRPVITVLKSNFFEAE